MATLSPQLEQLLLQARYAPENKRSEQLDACERLIPILTPGKTYPFDFICYHITGYKPRSTAGYQEGQELSCENLLAQIPLYAANLSKDMDLTPRQMGDEKWHTIESLARHFRLCRRTISRWRSKGLVGLYLQYPDGHQRLSFRASMLEHFLRENRPQLQEQPEQKKAHRIQPKQSQWSIPQELRTQIAHLHEQGETAEELARRFKQNQSEIYRAIHSEQARNLLAEKIFYIPSEEFATAEQQPEFLQAPKGLFPNDPQGRDVHQPELTRDYEQENLESVLGCYLREIHTEKVLTGKQEQFLFRKYNYLKYLAKQLQQRLDPDDPSLRWISQIRKQLRESRNVRDYLIRNNLRLVVSIARKHARGDMDMLELISEGNVSLLNAIEKFDYQRGAKFSTYATWAVVRRYATLYGQLSKATVYEATEAMLELAHNLRVQPGKVAAVESARKNLQQVMTENLNEREQYIVQAHYGLAGREPVHNPCKPVSLAQIAQKIGLSKERVRQIELLALSKLRQLLAIDEFDLLSQI